MNCSNIFLWSFLSEKEKNPLQYTGKAKARMWTRFFSQIVHAVHEAFAVHRVQYIMAISIISDVLGSHGLEGSREFWQKAYHGTQDICYSLYGTHIAKAEDSSLTYQETILVGMLGQSLILYFYAFSHEAEAPPYIPLCVSRQYASSSEWYHIFLWTMKKSAKEQHSCRTRTLFGIWILMATMMPLKKTKPTTHYTTHMLLKEPLLLW